MSDLNKFFEEVKNSKNLQEQLYKTKELSEVAQIAASLGFNVSAAEIIKAQAGRVLMLEKSEVELLAQGKKAATGAQWGREGNGYLDAAGFWVVKFLEWQAKVPSNEPQVELFLERIEKNSKLKDEVLKAKTHNELALIANKEGFVIDGVLLVRYQALQILHMKESLAEQVAKGAGK